MSNDDALKQAFRGSARPEWPARSPRPDRSDRAERRARRADRTRAQALSPVRILTQLLFLPVAVVAITISVYIRTSPYERTDALRHLAAMAGCDTAASMGLAPARAGELGYHARNDPDGDGVACGTARGPGPTLADWAAAAPPDTAGRSAGGAKFLKP